MSTDDSIQFSATDSSTCRILTVASSIDRAVSLVDRVRNLRKPSPSTSSEPSTSTSTSVLDPAPAPQPNASGLGESTRIPWTLSNNPHIVRNVPAVIFVWAKGDQDFRHHVERLAGDMNGYEPEVSLAVRLAPSANAETEDDSGDAEDEEAELDEFLSSNGFEFIDASEETPPSEEDAGGFSQGIPGLPRVLDALSTIMWPSMQAKPKPSGVPRLARRDLDWAQTSQDDMSPIKQLAHGGNTSSKQQEMDELTRWLEGDDDVFSKEDPWRPAADSAALATSPTDIDMPISPVTGKKPREGEEEDDFEDDSFDSPRLGPPESSLLYLSLGSALDLREVGEEKEKEKEKEDEDLPTDAEIEAMSSRIFGAPMRSKGETASPMADAVPVDAGEEEYDMAPFDLSRVMSALEGMKAEIASMEDEGERRKAAAKVALGLVYGLEADAGIDNV
ncbi:hypothetical protein B0H16DRAFT_1492620 [Mycena metata]|uniref:Alpha and gamma adaptin binding protein p34 n=1 Tax=Mycena metata TaxID=1033252 RepID=A0AAD7P1V2_9AGAR|nr:hypothetical protein B0H16DRAFT_1492620 [Mycena metata]